MAEEEERVVPVDVGQEMRTSFLDYAMSVIVSRALPDVRDGLKPVQRRILYAMNEAGLTPDKPYKKSATVVGDVLGKYHPHGDVAVYDAMVRMAQPFNMRYPLVDGHGNFGSIDGDPPAAYRYTEVRLAPLAMELLRDIDKETVNFEPNYDGSLQEPTVLPSRLPNLLVNGSVGIAVGMATNIPPHNLREVAAALLLLLHRPEAEIEEILQVLPGPDFPTGALIVGAEGIRRAYTSGRGSIRCRAVCSIEQTNAGKNRIVVTELPYQVNKARLVESIADLVKEKRIDGITDLRDESDRRGMRVVIELRRDAKPQVVLNQLYKHTALETTFGAILLALVDGRPKILSIKEMLLQYLSFQEEVVRRRIQFDLRKAQERAHILEGLRIAVDQIDAVIELIRSSHTIEAARRGLMERFGLDEIQANAILEMRLQRLTGLEREKLEEEYATLLGRIETFRAILADEQKLRGVIESELTAIVDRFGDERRTKIVPAEGEIRELDLISPEELVVSMSHRGYIKRLPLATYRSQHRGGRGVAGMATGDHDFVERLFVANARQDLLFFTDRGRVYRLAAYEIPEFSRTAKGVPIVNLLPIESGETITAVIPVEEGHDGYLFMATAAGIVKKSALEEFANVRKNGIIAITFREDDHLVGVQYTQGDDEIILATRLGQAIRFSETEVRAMGRTAYGVRGITLTENDWVVGCARVTPEAELLAVTEHGYGKRTSLQAYSLHHRGGSGVRNITITKRNGPVVSALSVVPSDELMLMTEKGIAIRIAVADISRTGRSAQGVKLMDVKADDRITTVACLQNGLHEEEET